MEINVPKIFGSNVFNREVMKQRLSKKTYAALMDIIENGGEMDHGIATEVATAMKEWAIEKGATHFTHWFQPMTGITAEKHESFIRQSENGGVIMDFSAKNLIKGEPDASSFPSGGLRATFEARGYTAWDPTSLAFVKDGSLYIPTIFCSYSGDVLDKKTPLLRSTEEVSKQALRIVKILGDTEVKKIYANAGAEQEYFLIDRNLFEKRKDLVLTGTTLFGSKPPKGQELEDHYFGALRPRVSEFMHNLDIELWKLGVYSKIKHNEVAPGQHELAPIYTNVNLATDQNQLMMEIMKKVAEKNGLACLLHEKPFAGLNGSGKHNNWSLSTDTGRNILEPGKEPEKNIEFLLFISAMIKAVDEHQDLLRISVSTSGNDKRLGGSEAPPSILSMFLGEDLTAILSSIEKGSGIEHSNSVKMDSGVSSVPEIWKDKTDRNRTSPFAFTGNKFEFRMPGSGISIAGPNIMLNTIMADVLMQFADKLEKSKDIEKDARKLIAKTFHEHKKIVFNGNNYAKEWVEEAQKRGLLILKNTVDAVSMFDSKENIELFSRHKIFTENEIKSRKEILLDNYKKTMLIEAATMVDMVKKDILPACIRYESILTSELESKKSIGLEIGCSTEMKILRNIDKLLKNLYKNLETVSKKMDNIKNMADGLSQARYICDELNKSMEDMRKTSDELEEYVPSDIWPFPTYCDLLFSV